MLTIKHISAEQTFLLRHQVLRPKQSPLDCSFDCDNFPHVFHIGAFSASHTGIEQDNSIMGEPGYLIGVATFFIELTDHSLDPFVKGNSTMSIKDEFSEQYGRTDVTNIWRLRGMATAASARGLGVGSQVLAVGLQHIKSRLGKLLWCNARTTATDFYSKQGFLVGSERFDIDGIGPHCIMYKCI